MIHNIFTEKTVGLAFAAAFALWAWMLNGLADNVLLGVRDIQDEQTALKAQIVELRSTVVLQQIEQARILTEVRERQSAIARRVEVIEGQVDNRRDK